MLDRPIKAIGVQDVKIALHPEVSVTITVNVARSPEEAELQAQGVDVMAEMFEKDVAGFTEERDEHAEPGEIQTEPAEAAETAETAKTAETAETAESAETGETGRDRRDRRGRRNGRTGLSPNVVSIRTAARSPEPAAVSFSGR